MKNKLSDNSMLLSIVLIIVLLCGPSFAETNNKAKKITKKQAISIAADVFSIKCGIPREVILKSRIKTYKKSTEWTVEFLRFAKPYNEHGGHHWITLSLYGDLIEWSAHYHAYNELYPDIMSMGTEIVPAETDAQQTEILQKIACDLQNKYSISDTEAYEYEARFKLHPCFAADYNTSKVPVWLVNVYFKEELVWKAVYTYRGELMSLVSAEQDFTTYTIPNEEFDKYAFGPERDAKKWEKHNVIRSITQNINEYSEEDIKQLLDEQIPLYREWLKEHPYSTDPQLEEIISYYPQLVPDDL